MIFQNKKQVAARAAASQAEIDNLQMQIGHLERLAAKQIDHPVMTRALHSRLEFNRNKLAALQAGKDVQRTKSAGSSRVRRIIVVCGVVLVAFYIALYALLPAGYFTPVCVGLVALGAALHFIRSKFNKLIRKWRSE